MANKALDFLRSAEAGVRKIYDNIANMNTDLYVARSRAQANNQWRAETQAALDRARLIREAAEKIERDLENALKHGE